MPDHLDYLKRRAHTLRMGLFQRLDEICVSDFPTGSPKEVIKLLQDILDKISLQIDSASDEQTLALICQVIHFYCSFLEYFDNAHTEQTPRGLVQLLEELMSELSPEAKLLVWPQAIYNYSIRDILPTLLHTTENLLPENERKILFAPFNGPINLISFPRIERDDILVHAVFGHELGHPIAEQYLKDEQTNQAYTQHLKDAIVEIDISFSGEFSALPPAEAFTRKEYLTNLMLNVRTRGLEELVSDCVAVLLFGPSALFALYDIFSTSVGLDAPPSFPDLYPPSRYRIRLAKQLMDQEGYTERLVAQGSNQHLGSVDVSIKDMLSYIDNAAADKSDLLTLEGDPLLKIAYDWLAKSIPNAIEYAKSRISQLVYSKDAILEDIPGLLDRLALGIPPNEVGVSPYSKVVDWRSAILAAWLCKIHGYKKGLPDPVPMNSSDIDRLQKITLRAVEYILLQKRYAASIAS